MPSFIPPITPAAPSASQSRLAGWLRGTAQLLVIAAALLFLLLAVHMDRDWAGRHLLPDILVASDWLMAIIQAERAILLLLALLLLLAVFPRPGRSPAQRGDAALLSLRIGAMILLALPASEVVRQFFSGRNGQPWNQGDQPLRRPDATLGWVTIPGRRALDPEFPWRPLYVIDRHGYRVAAPGLTVDTAAPSILFVGESIMFGKGLAWDQSVAGLLQRQSGIQSANLSVTAYSAGQTFLRLRQELPRFRRPVAVVILFAPTLLVRDLDRTRPWFDSAGHLHPAQRGWNLTRLAHVLFPYRSPAAIAEAVATDRRLLLTAVAMVRARGAVPIVLVPVFQPEPARERELHAAIFDHAAIPHLVVPLGRGWRLLPDFHPDAHANAVMAAALWARLKNDPQAAVLMKNSLAFANSSCSEVAAADRQGDHSREPRRCHAERRPSGAP